jgi:hypothetical protein
MILKLTPAVVALAKGLPIEESAPVLFDPDTYEFFSPDDEIPSAILRETLVEFPKVRRVDVQRAYVEYLNDKSISAKFRSLTDEQFWHKFWKVFDDGSIRLSRFWQFEENYYLSAIKSWCDDNGIAYYVTNGE